MTLTNPRVEGSVPQPSTIAVHGDRGIQACADVAPPLHVSTTFLRSVDGFEYSREDQPTRRRLETVIGKLEGGHAVTYSSGQAAAAAVLRWCRPRRVAIDRGYFGTHDLLGALAADGLQRVELHDRLGQGDLVWLETPKNPACELEDIAHHVRRAQAAGAIVVVDSTLATPVLQNPLSLGADVVVHSSTKFLAGHSDALGGVVAVRDANIAEQLREEREVFGAVPGALETWLTLRSLRTLYVRVLRQSETAEAVARWLGRRVPVVSYPALSEWPQSEVFERQMRRGGGMLAVELDDDTTAQAVAEQLSLFTRAVSLGGVESLVDWRHEYDRLCPATLLRFSIGLESADDLIADLAQAMQHAGSRYVAAG